MDYMKKIDRMGAVAMYSAVGLLLCVPLAISIYYDAFPTLQMMLKAAIPTLMLYVPVQFIEIVTYVPLLGRGGSYLSFITGNISNMKAPVVMNALETFDTDTTTEEGDIIATLAVATSSLVTNIVLAIGVILFLVTGLADVMQKPELAPAFDNLLASLFGALGVVFIGKNWKIAIAPIALMLTLFFVLGEAYNGIASVLVPVAALCAIGVARILYKKGLI